MRTLVIPPHPGVLSALGLAAAAERVDVLASYHRELDGLHPTDIGRAFSPLLRDGSEQLPGAALWRYVDCRFVGQGYELTIPVATNSPRQIRDAFLAAHRERLGHEGAGQAVELVNLRVVAVREAPLPQLAGTAGTKRPPAKARGRRSVVLGPGSKRVTASLWPLDDLGAGVTPAGPGVLAGRGATPRVAARRGGPLPRPGDVFILNDPYTGGSHLPDITLIGAVDVGGAIGGYSVVRAHHSDVGGVQAGSMPAGAREIFAEGVIVPPLLLTPEVERMLLANVRTPETRRGDLAAQRAAVERGADGVRALAARYGWPAVGEAARDLMDYAERRTREALGRMAVAGLTATDWLEGDGIDDVDLPVTVRVNIRDGVVHADFTGTAPAARGHVNCPLAGARAAGLCVVRTVLPEDVPTNGGVGRAVRVTAPEGCLVNARPPSAVAAGNVETSQRIVDTLFLALARGGIPVPAQGQGTMNNITFGGQRATGNVQPGGEVVGGWTYYETIGGGQGASSQAPGPSGVHVGMSNTRNTPVEVLEMEHSFRLQAYALP